MGVWTSLLAPVPIMRVRINDHTMDQVIVGSTMGVVYAATWHWVVGWLVRKHSRRVGRGCFVILTHDYRPPEFRVKITSSGRVLHGGVEIIEPDTKDFTAET